MASAAPSRPVAQPACDSKQQLMEGTWHPGEQTQGLSLCRRHLVLATWPSSLHTTSVHLLSSPLRQVLQLTAPNSRCRNELREVRGLYQDTAGKRWNLDSDPGLSDHKAHVPNHCAPWLLDTRFPPAMRPSEKRGKLKCGP